MMGGQKNVHIWSMTMDCEIVQSEINSMSKLMECPLSGVEGNGGEHHHHPDDHGHDHDHDHGHGHGHGHGHEEDGEELAALIKSFGVAVLGKVRSDLRINLKYILKIFTEIIYRYRQ